MVDKNLMDELDPEVKARVLYWGKRYDISPTLVLQNIIIGFWARQAAAIICQGDSPAPIYTPEFGWEIGAGEEKQLVTGEKLFNILVETYAFELKKPGILQAQEQLQRKYPDIHGFENQIRQDSWDKFESEIAHLPTETQAKLKEARRKDDDLQRAWEKRRHNKTG